MAIMWTNKREVNAQFKKLEILYNTRAIEYLSMLGERVVKYAKENGNYTDRTANLRNSIGYIVVQSGKVVVESFTGGISSKEIGGNEAMAKEIGKTYAEQLVSEYSNDKTYLVWVAGMEYAAYVEAKDYDVIQGSGDWVESMAQAEMEKFKRWLMKRV